MEIKSNNVLIGAFTIIVVALMFLFLLWITGMQFNRQIVNYKIVFEGSVSGLSVSGPVQYNGLPVGKVTDLYLMENNPNKVVAIIEVDSRTPVKEDSVAQLELSGLTGVAFIQLTGGSEASAPLTPKPGQDYAIIRAAPSSLQDLLKSGPETLQSANELLKELNTLVVSNQKAVSDSLENLNVMSKALADNAESVTTIITQLSETSRNLNQISGSANALMKDDVKAFIDDARDAARSYRDVAIELDAVLKQSGPGLGSGLSQLPQLVAETRALVSSLDRLASRAQDDPARFLIGRNVPEVEP